MPLISFVVPLVAKENCRDWQSVSDRLGKTLKCVYEQTITDLRVIIVATDEPEIEIDGSRTVIREYERPLKNKHPGARSLDKERRMKAGLDMVDELGGSHFVMFLDSDDLIHRSIVEFVHDNADMDGFVFGKGYIWWRNASHVYPVEDFCRRCGSGYIFRYRRPEVQSVEESRRKIEWTLTAHNKFADRQFEKRHQRYASVPFPAGIYVRGHADSIRSEWRRSSRGCRGWHGGAGLDALREVVREQMKLILFGKRIDNEIRNGFPGLAG